MKKSNLTLLRDIQILLSENISKKLLNELNDKVIVTNKDTGNSYEVSKDYYNANKAKYDIAKPGTKPTNSSPQKPKFKAVKQKPSNDDIVNMSSIGKESTPTNTGNSKPHPSFKSLKKVMNSDIFDGAKYNWKQDGPKLNSAIAKMSQQGDLTEDDVTDLYLHTTAGTPLNNKSLAKRKGFKEFEQAMENASNNIIERENDKPEKDEITDQDRKNHEEYKKYMRPIWDKYDKMYDKIQNMPGGYTQKKYDALQKIAAQRKKAEQEASEKFWKSLRNK